MSPVATNARAVREALARLGGVWVEPDLLQPAGLYLDLAGEEIRRRAFLVEDGAGEELCLRPDMTAPAVRAALALPGWRAGEPFAICYEGLVFRRRREATSGAVEFVQAGAEFFAPLPAASAQEAEIIAAGLELCRAAGVEPALSLGDVGLFRALVGAGGLPPPWGERLIRAFAAPGGVARIVAEAGAPAPPRSSALGEALAALPEAAAAAAVAEVLQVAGIAPVGGRSVVEVAARLRENAARARAPRPPADRLALISAALAIEGPPDAALKALAKLTRPPHLNASPELDHAIERARARWAALKTLTRPPDATRFSLGLGRGLAYYDGFVFELEAPILGQRAGLGGGGRYDGLLQALARREQAQGLEAWAASGFAVRLKRLEDAALGRGP